ncbi:hypothetical protein INF20_07690 [Eubacteriaceae bacterium DSM 108706]|uniref:Uncharacterized protein n=1 Tax=Gallibacter intestinalis TaxID=2779356 RepID=A0ABR9QZ43_9FIRM|nr:hypothetical protein [Gallibacter intestinalis]
MKFQPLPQILPTLFVQGVSCFKQDKTAIHIEFSSVIAVFTNSFCPISLKGVKLEENASTTTEEIKGTYNRRSGQSNVEFAGSDNPVRPELKWFRHDDIINRLIDMRMDINNPIKSDSLILQGSSSATMTQAVAKAIDATVSKIGIKGTTSMQTEAENEKHTKLKFDIEF